MKQRESGLPFDDFRNLIANLPDGNNDMAAHTLESLSDVVGDQGSKAASICEWYSRWSGRSPVVHRPLLTLFAGTHAINDEIDGGKNSAQILSSVTEVAEGRAVANRLCSQHGLGLKLFDLALQLPVADISNEAALDEKSCAGTIAFGMEAIAGGSDLLSICAIDPAPDYSSLAILCVLHDLSPSAFDLPENAQERFAAAVSSAKGHASNALEVLRRLGGRETAALTGAILSARTEHVPVVIGGTAGLAACAVLHAQNESAINHCIFATKTGVERFDALMGKIGLEQVLDASVSPTSGADVVIAASIVQSACKHFSSESQATIA